jgi:hypothetical protein
MLKNRTLGETNEAEKYYNITLRDGRIFFVTYAASKHLATTDKKNSPLS